MSAINVGPISVALLSINYIIYTTKQKLNSVASLGGLFGIFLGSFIYSVLCFT